MHRSRIGALVIDCHTEDLEASAAFWSAALGCEPRLPHNPEYAARYRALVTDPEEVAMLVQKVDHPSRVHLDIETDDVEAEVARLEALGARRLQHIDFWWVMEAPTGHRFCVVPVERAGFEDKATVWGEQT